MQQQPYFPPKFAIRWLEYLCHPDFLEDILGDLVEEYRFKRTNRSEFATNWWFVLQVAGMMRPSLMRPFLASHKLKNKIDMINNYITVGWRSLMKYKTGTTINLLGLSTGMAAFIIIALFVKDELSYDQHHEHADNIFRVTVNNFEGDGQTISRQWAFASAGHAPRLKQDFSQVLHAVRFQPWAFPDIVIGDRRFPSEQVVFTDVDVFKVFTFPFLAGDMENAFEVKNSIVISESSAIKLFGNDWRNQEIIGKDIRMERGELGMGLTVTGVMQDLPPQQHFHFDYFVPFGIFENIVNNTLVTDNVSGNYNFLTYVRVSSPDDAKAIEAGSDAFFDKYIGSVRGVPAHDYYSFTLQPLKSIHLHSALSGEIENNGKFSQVVIFAVIGVLLLVIACINYMNLATSRYTRRMKEVGVRKAIGAEKSSLVAQFVTESAMLTLISLPIAIGLAALALPYVNVFMDKDLSVNFFVDYQLFLGVLCLAVLVALLAGLYPAVYLSSVNTIKALKGEASFRTHKVNFRSILVTFQYMVTLGIIFALAVVNEQMKFIFNSDPGYDKESVLQVPISREIGTKMELFKSELLSNPNIVRATYQSRIPTGALLDNQNASIFLADSITPIDFRLPYVTVDEDFLGTFGIDLIAGKDFERYMISDTVGYFIVNEVAAQMLGFSDPADAVGKKIRYGIQNGNIVGVTKNFHFESVHHPIGPMLLAKSNDYLRSICLKINPTALRETIGFVEATWAKFDDKNPINYTFVDESFERQYQAEERLSIMFRVFAIIAILIGCLGMLGMVTFIVERKTKEIGIRKVLGAKSPHIMWLVSESFLWLIGFACIISLPLGYYFMSNWLNGFAYQINISILLMLVPLLVVLAITILTILYRVILAIKINPVMYLRSE